jgi:hypothetical protein
MRLPIDIGACDSDGEPAASSSAAFEVTCAELEAGALERGAEKERYCDCVKNSEAKYGRIIIGFDVLTWCRSEKARGRNMDHDLLTLKLMLDSSMCPETSKKCCKAIQRQDSQNGKNKKRLKSIATQATPMDAKNAFKIGAAEAGGRRIYIPVTHPLEIR